MAARGRLLSGLVTMVIALAGFLAFGALPAAANSDNVQYVALGDSFAAGAGAPPYSDRICLQSDDGYPGVLNSAERIDLQVNAACAGLKSTEVALPSGLNEDTRLVTLTVGGNDLGFANLAGECLTEDTAKCLEAIRTALGGLPDLHDNLTALYRDVAKAAPNARIVVTGYPFLFESPTPGAPNEDIITALRAATAALNETIEDAVAATHDENGVKIVYVDVTTAFKDHGIGCGPSPACLFINPPGSGVPGAVPFHPNAAGYNAYADAISDVLPNGWLDKTSRRAASP